MNTYTISTHEKISIWQRTTFKVDAKSEKEAKRLIAEDPKHYAIDVFENFWDTEEVLEIDFEDDVYQLMEVIRNIKK